MKAANFRRLTKIAGAMIIIDILKLALSVLNKVPFRFWFEIFGLGTWRVYNNRKDLKQYISEFSQIGFKINEFWLNFQFWMHWKCQLHPKLVRY
jgi:hypothetical protein